MTQPESAAAPGAAPDLASVRTEASHVFDAATAMLGVCVTIVGVFAALRGGAHTLGDNVLALDALLFMAASVLGYVALRIRDARRAHRLVRAADAAFLFGLLTMVVAGVLFAYELM